MTGTRKGQSVPASSSRPQPSTRESSLSKGRGDAEGWAGVEQGSTEQRREDREEGALRARTGGGRAQQRGPLLPSWGGRATQSRVCGFARPCSSSSPRSRQKVRSPSIPSGPSESEPAKAPGRTGCLSPFTLH